MRRGPLRHVAAAVLAVCLASAGLAGCVQYATAPPITPFISPTPTAVAAEPQSRPAIPSGLQEAWLLVSIEENGYAHLFRFELASAALTRLTWGDWNDITPSLSPNGALMAFASDRGGAWDLYVMDLQSGSVTQLTDTPEYDGAPIWSPDMAWMAYETYNNGQMDIAIQSVTDSAAVPVLLTEDPGSDHSPAWAPDGRRIAFVSSRTGDSDIWLADLDKTSERFVNLSASPRAAESHPTWSRDGSRLAWAARVNGPGYSGIYVWDAARRGIPAVWAGSGIWPVWSTDGTQMAVVLDEPTQQLISAYTLNGPQLILPAPLPGVVRGFAWPDIGLPTPLPSPFQQASLATPDAPAAGSVDGLPDVPSKRWHVVPLEDVQAPSAGLHALVAPSFAELRSRVVAEAGWDVLASLESAFVPFTTSLDPGLQQDWLYTGRAFTINTLMLNAGWMAAMREDIGDRTFWRIFIRTRDQDGSQGIPINDPPWDLNTRYQLDPQAYEDGGSFAPVPSGYWIDFTSLAEHYGWHRLPALPGWRTYYAGARFSEFAATGGLDWYSAMLELYPAEALITPTAVLPPTITPSRTPRPTTTPYPTWTPRPTRTATISPVPSASSTPLPPTPTPPTVIPTFPSSTP